MERLTQKYNNKNVAFLEDGNLTMQEIYWRGWIEGKLVDAIAAYQETGLSPEEITRLKAERDAAVKYMAELGFCTHYPGYTCDKEFPAACPKCISRWLKKKVRGGAE